MQSRDRCACAWSAHLQKRAAGSLRCGLLSHTPQTNAAPSAFSLLRRVSFSGCAARLLHASCAHVRVYPVTEPGRFPVRVPLPAGFLFASSSRNHALCLCSHPQLFVFFTSLPQNSTQNPAFMCVVHEANPNCSALFRPTGFFCWKITDSGTKLQHFERTGGCLF